MRPAKNRFDPAATCLYFIFDKKSSLKLFPKIRLDKLDYQSILNLIFTTRVVCNNLFFEID